MLLTPLDCLVDLGPRRVNLRNGIRRQLLRITAGLVGGQLWRTLLLLRPKIRLFVTRPLAGTVKMRRDRHGIGISTRDIEMRMRKLCLMACGLLTSTQGTAQQYNPPAIMTVSPTGVNLLDGTFAYSATDILVGSLQLERIYLGGLPIAAPIFQRNWSHNFYSNIIDRANPDATKTVIIGASTYKFWGGGTPQNGYKGITFGLVDGIYTLTERDGTKFRFNGTGFGSVMTEIIHPNGYTVNLTYVSGKLRNVKDNRGYAIVFDYDGNNRVSLACGFNLAEVSISTASTCASATLRAQYAYNSGSTGTLASVTNVLGFVSNISYNASSSSDVTCVTTPGTNTCKVTNKYVAGISGVQEQVLADGTTWKFHTDGGMSGRTGNEDPLLAASASMTDPYNNGYAIDYLLETPIMVTDQLGRQFYPNYEGPIYTGSKLPEGNRIEILLSSRDAPAGFKWTPKTGVESPTATAKSYPISCANPITCNRPDTETDANGNLTSYTYDATHGDVLTKTGPVTGGIAPVVRYAYAQRNAWIKNAAGTGYVRATPAIWLMTEERTCKNSATVGGTCQAGASDEVVTTYDYGPDSGPNNLLLRGVVIDGGGLSLRTCYQYDSQGNKIAETKPRAGLTNCP